ERHRIVFVDISMAAGRSPFARKRNRVRFETLRIAANSSAVTNSSTAALAASVRVFWSRSCTVIELSLSSEACQSETGCDYFYQEEEGYENVKEVMST